MPFGSKSLRRFSLLFLCLLGSVALIPARPPSVEAAPPPVEASAAQGPPFLLDISMIAATDGWIVASHSTTYRWNGAYWHRLPPIPGVANLTAVSVVNANDVWAVGNGPERGVVVRWNGSSWHDVPTPVSSVNYHTISMLSATDGWLGGMGEVMHWNGTSWVKDTRLLNAYASAALSPTNVWMANTTLQRYNGTGWAYQDTKNVMPDDIMFSSPQQGWIVGREAVCHEGYCIDRGASAYWNGTSWIYVGLPPDIDALNGVYTSREAGTWAVGWNDMTGVILRWTGSKWESLPMPEGVGRVVDIAMVSPTFGWAIGISGELLYWNGIKWVVWAADIRKTYIPMGTSQ